MGESARTGSTSLQDGSPVTLDGPVIVTVDVASFGRFWITALAIGLAIEWIEMALEPLRDQVDEQRFERLVSALALCIGIEAVLVLRDIRGLNPAEAEEVSRWAAHALLRFTLSEQSNPLSEAL